jgi:hypothetical protein
MIGDALLYFGSFTAILVLFASVIAAIWWLLKRGLRAFGRLIRALTDE